MSRFDCACTQCRQSTPAALRFAVILVLIAQAVVLMSPVAARGAGTPPITPRPPAPVIDDNRLPGRPLAQTPSAGSLDYPTDRLDIYSIPLARGESYAFRVTRTGTGSFRMRLFGPGTTSIETGVPLGTYDQNELGAVFHLRPDVGGTHYIVLDTPDGAGTYRIWGPRSADMAPGIVIRPDYAWPVVNETGFMRSTADSIDVYRANLQAGLTYTFSATRTSGSGTLSLALFSPETLDVIGSPALATDTDTKVARISFTATSSGDHVLAVRQLSGASTYRLGAPGSAFGLDLHAYSFSNFGGTASPIVFKMTFGIPQPNALSPEAQVYYDDVYRTHFGHGQCYGFAVTAGMFYRGVFGPRPSDFSSRATFVRQLRRITTDSGIGQVDESIEKHISKYFYYQYDPTVRARESGWGEDFARIASMVETEVAQRDNRDPYVLLFSTPEFGHAVNITGVSDGYTPEIGWFAVYDNNVTGAYRMLGVNWFGGDSEPFMTSNDYGNVTSGYWLGIVPTSVHERASIPPLWTDSSSVGVSALLPAAEASVLHTDRSGRRLGRVDGQEVAEIPGAYRVRSFTGNLNPKLADPVNYYLPKSGDYRVDFSRKSAGWIRYDLFAGDVLARAQVASVKPSVKSTIQTLRANKGFSFTTESSAAVSATLALHRQRAALSRAYLFTGLKVASSQVVTIGSVPSGDAAGLRSDTPQRYGLQLTGFNGKTRISTSISASITADTTQTIVPWDWRRLKTVPVFVVEGLPNGRETITALQCKGLTPTQFAAELASRGQVPASLSAQLRSKLGANSSSLRTYLTTLVDQKRLTKRSAGMLYAFTIGNRLTAGRAPMPTTLPVAVAAPRP